MRKPFKESVARRFKRLDIHDDNLRLVTLHPPRTKQNLTTIDLELEDDGTGAAKLLSFLGCANLRLSMDFDVLADNWIAQTQGCSAETNVQKMKKFVRAQKSHWHVSYAPPMPQDMPIRK